ncbi:MAG: ABC transporter ATP-binding protein [Solirubrobacterales bacterium]|nr:ABC transporter ATP-binding protein [Solirubrobacterales bacterium]MBV9047613.1 ABC transporter ATP-binding protein [Solirubrobacterales bacterium]
MGRSRDEGELPGAVIDGLHVALATRNDELAEPILRLRGVGRQFGGLRAVADVDLELAPGERRAVLGPNGAGKTTLFNLISGEFPPSEGTIELFGRDVTYEPAQLRGRHGLRRTYQTSKLFLGLTVEDNVYLSLLGERNGHLRLVITSRDRELREMAQAAAEVVGLGGRLHTIVGDLSHGEQRQLEVGMARATNPKLMMLDEPAAGLSANERRTLTELLLALDPDITVVLIEHDMDVALRVAQRVTMMYEGRIVAEGTPSEIRGNQLVHDLYLGSRYHDE